MKKKILMLAFAVLSSVGICKAMEPVYKRNLITNSPITYSTAPALDLDALGIDYISFQANYSSSTAAAFTFNDGRVSTAAVTVGTNSLLTAIKSTDSVTVAATSKFLTVGATNQITVISTTGLSGASLNLNGTVYVAGRDWVITTATGTAESIRLLINGSANMSASRVSTVIFATATLKGVIGNTYTLTSSTPSVLSVASAHFSGGLNNIMDNVILTVNGTGYRNGGLWSAADTSTGTAVNISNFLNTFGVFNATTTGNGGVVIATATTGGTAGNSYTLSSSNSTALLIASANFTGGRDAASVKINGVTVSFSVGATSALTAKAISDGIMANSSLNTVLRSTWSAAAVVTATSTAVGSVYNYTLVVAPTPGLTASGSTMSGGSNSATTISTSIIVKTAHGLSTGFPVQYTSAFTLSPLVTATTYYAINIDANDFGLARTSTDSIAGNFIVITSSSIAGPHTFTITPLTMTGSPSFKWQVSNDAVNWNDVNVSSVTFSSPYTTASSFWDLGLQMFRYLRLNILAPTAGGMNLEVIGNGKHSNP